MEIRGHRRRFAKIDIDSSFENEKAAVIGAKRSS